MMNWKNFSSLVHAGNYSSDLSSKGRMSELLIGRGVINNSCEKYHAWYPRGVKNSEYVNGFRYVDMNHSYFGEESVLVSEASCCMIMILLDRETQLKFSAHISAASDMKRLPWLLINTDLKFFFKSISCKLERASLYLFSNKMDWNMDGSFEHRNIMSLLSASLSQKQLEELSRSTYLFQGENGVRWNPFCAVRLKNSNAKQMMEISFVNPSIA